MDQKSGKVYAFLILAAFTIVAWFFIYYMLPETKGQPIAENVKNILKRGPKTSSNSTKDDNFSRQQADPDTDSTQ